jgi:putative membrane protein insertion efficiency factor
MPALRKLVAAACLLAALAGFAIDARRPAPERIGSRLYIASVLGYQRFGRPVVRRVVVCRFDPSCSEYSLQAVRRFGLATGLRLTASRLLRCRPGATGGPDQVPSTTEADARFADGAGHS